MNRTRTVSWDDPMIGAAAGREMAGREYLEAIRSGELPAPPVAHLLGFDLATIDEGRATFTITPAEYHYNPIGAVHGGIISTLLDSAMGCAVHTMLPAGVGYTTLEIKVNFVRPLTRDTGEVFCEGHAIHVGSRTATAEGRLVDADGTLYAHGTTTCLLFRP